MFFLILFLVTILAAFASSHAELVHSQKGNVCNTICATPFDASSDSFTTSHKTEVLLNTQSYWSFGFQLKIFHCVCCAIHVHILNDKCSVVKLLAHLMLSEQLLPLCLFLFSVYQLKGRAVQFRGRDRTQFFITQHVPETDFRSPNWKLLSFSSSYWSNLLHFLCRAWY